MGQPEIFCSKLLWSKQFLNQILNIIQALEKDSTNCHFIITGDMNIVQHNELDMISGNPHKQEIVDKFVNITREVDIYDTWRLLHNEEKQHT